MSPTIIIVADGLTHRELAARLGPAAPRLAAGFLADTVAVARTLRGARVVVRHGPHFPATGLPQGLESAPIASADGPHLAAILAEAAADGGPALLIGADLPHLPPWRLRDALTHLTYGADVVIGPSDRGDWYLLGLRAPTPELLPHIPARGASPEGLRRAARDNRLEVVALPAWYAVRTSASLAAVAGVLRTMPSDVAPQTRALLATESLWARAVGG